MKAGEVVAQGRALRLSVVNGFLFAARVLAPRQSQRVGFPVVGEEGPRFAAGKLAGERLGRAVAAAPERPAADLLARPLNGPPEPEGKRFFSPTKVPSSSHSICRGAALALESKVSGEETRGRAAAAAPAARTHLLTLTWLTAISRSDGPKA